MSPEAVCWFCGTTLPPNDGGQMACHACHRPHFLVEAGGPPTWLPCEPGAYELQGPIRLTEYGYQGLARHRDAADLVTVTLLRVPESVTRSHILADARRVAGSAHLNVVRLRDAGEDGQVFWVAHDRFEGLELDDWHAHSNTQPRSSVHARLDFLSQAAKGLAFLHANSLTHGRLHPGNILVADDGGVRLMYSGLASLAMQCARQRSSPGNPHKLFEESPYAAPEVNLSSNASPAADCYSYGVIAYQLLSSLVPRGRFKPVCDLVSGCPVGVSRCIDRCLEVAPTDRPPADQIVRSHFDADWGIGNPRGASRFIDSLRGFASRLGSMVSDQRVDFADAKRGEGLATSIAWETFSFGLIGLLLGHVFGVLLGTLAITIGFSAGLAISTHHLLFVGSGLVAAAAGLWRERSLLCLKSLAAGRAFLRVLAAAERYRDPMHKAADALKLIGASNTPDQLPLEDLRRLLSVVDEAVRDLENASFGGNTLPAVHQELAQAGHRLLGLAAEKAILERQYGVARTLYARLAGVRPDDAAIAGRATQLTDLVERQASRIDKLLADGQLEEAARRLQSLAKHFPQDEMIEELRARYEERHSLLNDTKAESLAQLVRENRWHRIGQIADGLNALNLPLGGYARVADEITKRRSLFAHEQESALVALKRLGPRLATPWLERLRAMMRDHPFVAEFAESLKTLTAAQDEMRRTIETQSAARRWIAADSTMRMFLLEHGLGSTSLLDAAQNMAGHLQAERARWRLLLWFVFGGAGVIAFSTMFSAASWSEASFIWRDKLPIPQDWQPVFGPAFIAGLQILAAGVALSVMLTVIGRNSVALLPIFIGLAIAVAATSALPPAFDVLRRHASTQAPQALRVFLDAVPVLVNIVAWLTLFSATASCAASAPSWSPSPLGALIAMVSVYGLRHSQAWVEFLPQGFAAAAFLAIAGIVASSRAWLAISFASVVASILATTSSIGEHKEFFNGAVAPAVAVLVAGAFVLGKRRAADYLWLIVAVIWACAVCWFIRSLKSGDILERIATIWMIACGGVAVANQSRLGAGIRIADLARSYAVSWRCRSSSLRGSTLAKTDWYADNRAWHATNVATTVNAKAQSSERQRRVSARPEG